MDPSRPHIRTVAVVGAPNTGKSTFFNRLTGASARVANWPGMTVDVTTARLLLGDAMVKLADLPGIYSLDGHSDDEALVQRFLGSVALDAIVAVVNATRIELQLPLVLALKATGVPVLVVLNMADEAAKLGVAIDVPRLAQELGAPVVSASAKYGRGIDDAMHALRRLLDARSAAAVADLARVPAREAREREASRLREACVHMPAVLPAGLTAKLDRFLLHPWLGIPLFLVAMFAVFQAVYGLGAPLQDGMKWLLDALKNDVLAVALAGAPALVRSFVLDGLVDGVGTVLTFLPLMVVFFGAMAIVEDSGYLSRAAWLMDALMGRLGLDGRAFVMQLMGFGCNVPALMGTRVMRSRGLRLLTMLMIPFSLCSARLQVFVFLTTAIFSPTIAPLVLFSLYVASFGAGFLTALLYRRGLRNTEPLLLELPPYRFPTGRQMLLRGWQETSHFLREAGPLIMLGVILVWFLTHYPFDAVPASPDTLAGRIAAVFAPVFQPIGIDSLLTVALLFGFVAKEIVLGALAVIYGVGQDNLASVVANRIDGIQAYSFMLFVLIYTPCLSTVAVLKQESRSWSFTALAVAWPLVLAWVVSFVFYRVATWLV